MGMQGMCTTLAVMHEGKLIQIRPRHQHDNSPIFLTSFGYSEATMNAFWQPGRQVEIEGWKTFPEHKRRKTHPEDVFLINHEGALLQDDALTPSELVALVAPFTFPTIEALYPFMDTQQNGKGFVPGNSVNPRSVGYIVCRVALQEEQGKVFGSVRDSTGQVFLCSFKDERLLAQIRSGAVRIGQRYDNVLVRFSLAEAIDVYGSMKCFLLLSSIVNP